MWFSMGAASACMVKICAYLKPLVVYCNTAKDEHPDNARFRKEVEAWTGIKVTVIGSDKYETTDEVFEDTQYMSGVGGARCTTELKKIPRLRFAYPEDVHCFGFTADEQNRIAEGDYKAFRQSPKRAAHVPHSCCDEQEIVQVLE